MTMAVAPTSAAASTGERMNIITTGAMAMMSFAVSFITKVYIIVAVIAREVTHSPQGQQY